MLIGTLASMSHKEFNDFIQPLMISICISQGFQTTCPREILFAKKIRFEILGKLESFNASVPRHKVTYNKNILLYS